MNDRRDDDASPPCGADEASPGWLGFADAEEIRDLLRELLAAERAGCAAITALCLPGAPPAARATLVDLARDEARCAGMLLRQLRRYGDAATVARGAFYERMAATSGREARLKLLDRGQDWVVRRLAAALPRIRDDALREDLAWMHALHERNVVRGRALLDED